MADLTVGLSLNGLCLNVWLDGLRLMGGFAGWALAGQQQAADSWRGRSRNMSKCSASPEKLSPVAERAASSMPLAERAASFHATRRASGNQK